MGDQESYEIQQGEVQLLPLNSLHHFRLGTGQLEGSSAEKALKGLGGQEIEQELAMRP